MIGARFGSFQITAELGAGGMGEVWRATDTSLGREVALKLLPPDFADDPERHARFEREARVLASLNHPNIATLYGLEHLDGKHVLVMELVEGEGLDERIARGPIPVEDAIPIAEQIAEGLEAAHEAGIVHRDLKPANIRIRPDGTVKVLDFGLAKAREADTGKAGLTHSPTITHHHTRAGVILGTAAYMSPEQARGTLVDKRSDIWAFGVVLWEMLTGRALFGGDTVTDVLAAVVRKEIDVRELPRETPSLVLSLIARCVQRDPRLRLRDIGEARIVLSSPMTGLSGPPPAAGPSWTRRHFAVSAVIAGVGGAVGYVVGRRGTADIASGSGEGVLRITRLTSSGNVIAAAVSPDGRFISYVESSQGRQALWLRQITSGQSIRLIPERMVYYWGHSFSRDGNSILFAVKDAEDSRGRLFSISTLGGAEKLLLTGIDSIPALSPDGSRLAFLRERHPTAEQSALMLADANGAGVEVAATFTDPEQVAPVFFAGAAWNDDGTQVLVSANRFASTSSEARARLLAVAAPGGTVAVVSDPGWAWASNAARLPAGRGVVVVAQAPLQQAPQVWHVESATGVASQVTNDLTAYRMVSVSDDGRSLVTVAQDRTSAIWSGPLDGSVIPRRQTSARLDGSRGLSMSADGRLIYTSFDVGLWSVWSLSADASERRPILMLQPGESIYDVEVTGRGELFASVSTAAGIEVRVFDAEGVFKHRFVSDILGRRIGVSRDGVLVYTKLVDGRSRLFRLERPDAEPTLVTEYEATAPAIDPSGRRIAFYFGDTDGSSRIAVVDRAAIDSPQSFPAAPPAAQSRLRVRERSVYLSVMPGNRANVWRLSLDTGRMQQLTAYEDREVFDFALSDDERTIAVCRGLLSRDALLVRGFKGAAPERAL